MQAPSGAGGKRRPTDVEERSGGTVAFVRLYCDQEINEERLVADSRRARGKLMNVGSLRRAQTRWRLDASVPFRESLEIDNTRLDPETAARRIAAHLSLPLRMP